MSGANTAARFTAAVLIAVSLLGNTDRGTSCLAQSVASTEGQAGASQDIRSALFEARDEDSDGMLTEAEFSAIGGRPEEQLARDFRVFDMDADGRLSPAEFAGIPYLAPEGRPGSLPDAVALLAQARAVELAGLWEEWDENGDGGLNEKEFSAARPGRRVPGLEMTGFGDWDFDRDGEVTPEESKRLLEIAFGIRAPTGEPLRAGGRVLDWRMFRGRDKDGDGRISRNDYLGTASVPRGTDDREERFRSADADQDDHLDLTEFATTYHRTDPAAIFLRMDTNLDGRLTSDELEALSVDRRPMAKYLFPGFDDDGDGKLSLQEYQLTPVPNLLAYWQHAVDADHDGRLSLSEFQFAEPPALVALTAEYFRRLDTNEDGFLGVEEWTFSLDAARAPREAVLQQRDRNGDGRLSFEEVLGDRRRPMPGDRVDLAQEQALLLLEEAFRRADANEDGVLDRREFSTDAGLEVVAPGASALTKKVDAAVKPVVESLELDDTSGRIFVILGFNAVLIVAIAVFLFRKPKRP